MSIETGGTSEGRKKATSAERTTSLEKGERSELKRKALLLSMLGIFAAGEADHLATRYSIHENKMSNGEIVYEHEDKETTDILNYLSGKTDLTEEEKLPFYRALVKASYKNRNLQLPDNLEALNKKSLIQLIADGPIDRVFSFRREELLKGLEEIFDEQVPKYEYNPVLYKMMWKFEQEVGSPRIRWITNRVGETPPHYDPSTNTVFIANKFGDITMEEYIQESAHALQWKERPWISTGMAIRDYIQTGSASIALRKPIADVYKLEYNKPGTLEYEAHKIIAPKLLEKFHGKESKKVEKTHPDNPHE